MDRKSAAAVLLILLALALAACSLPGRRVSAGEVSQEDMVNTAAAKTVRALGTEIASGGNPTLYVSPTAGPTSTVTPEPSITPVPPTAPPGEGASPTETETSGTPQAEAPCHRAAFVRDVTINDLSTVLPNQVFTKTWELKNNGTCTWSADYAVVFAGSGNAMSGPASTPLTSAAVKPGETTFVSVKLRAPNEPGEYKGFWLLRSGDNKTFGTGEKGASPFWVEIRVGDSYHFADHPCSAAWSTGAGSLPCPGKASDAQGYILPVEKPTLEDNNEREGMGFITMPQPVAGGYIVGKFEPVIVPEQADFRATISCQPNSSGCYVRFRVTYRVDNGEEQLLGEWNEGFEGGVTEAIKDLDAVSGRSTAFNFYVYVAGTPDQSKAVWFDPRIIK